MRPANPLNKPWGVYARALGVEHQQAKVWYEATEIGSGLAIIGLEDGVAAHPQQAGHRLQEGVVVADDDARSPGGSPWGG